MPVILYRVEKRAADTDYARSFYQDNYHNKRQWSLVINSLDPLRVLLQRYQDSDLNEFRVKTTQFQDKDIF